jgi:hypothetical protein
MRGHGCRGPGRCDVSELRESTIEAGAERLHGYAYPAKPPAREVLQAALDEGGIVPADFDGLLTILDRYYPADVFNGPGEDMGTRLIIVAREMARLREAAEAILAATDPHEMLAGFMSGRDLRNFEALVAARERLRRALGR